MVQGTVEEVRKGRISTAIHSVVLILPADSVVSADCQRALPGMSTLNSVAPVVQILRTSRRPYHGGAALCPAEQSPVRAVKRWELGMF
jgi:hypothetical protein